jgi:hypothetical protein
MIGVPGNLPPRKPVNLCMRRSARFAAANTARDHRSRQLPSACPRPGVPALPSVRQEKVRPRRKRARARSTPIRRVRASGSLADGRASRAPYHEPSSASRAARRHALRFRSRHGVPPRIARHRLVPPRHGRQWVPRAPQAVPLQLKKLHGPERAGVDSDTTSRPRRPAGACGLSAPPGAGPAVTLRRLSSLCETVRLSRNAPALHRVHIRRSQPIAMNLGR